MPTAEFQQLSAGLEIWHTYDPTVKADLLSTAITAQIGLYLVDPIPLSDDQLCHLSRFAPIVGVIVTNANHARSAAAYSDRFSVPFFAHPEAFPDSRPTRFSEATGNTVIGGELQIIEIEGAVAGEIVLYQPSNRGTLIIGDALINFEPYGFTLLPRKYCQNEKRMRNSLRQLLARPVERIVFAHGTPILSGASARLQELLGPK